MFLFHWVFATMYTDYAIILIFLRAIVPVMGRWRVERILRGPETTTIDRLRLYASTIAFQWILVAVIFVRAGVHRLSSATLGLARSRLWLTVAVAAVLAALLLANQLVSLKYVGARPEDLRSKLARVALRIFPQDGIERLIFLAVVITVALCKELIYRGFAQAVFQIALHSVFTGIFLSAVLFSVAHAYQGRRGIIATLIVGLLFAAARSITQSLIPCVVGHFIVDFIAGYIFPGRLREELSKLEAAESFS